MTLKQYAQIGVSSKFLLYLREDHAAAIFLERRTHRA
jgi:hypothetical protein